MFSLRRLQIPLSVGLLAMLGTAGASAPLDQEEARRAMEAGQIRPLAEVMTSVEQRFVGKVVNIGLDQDQGRWLYHFKILPGSGLIYKLTIDAASGQVVNSHGLVQERR